MKPGIIQGALPFTLGNMFFVAPSASYTVAGVRGAQAFSASDDNSGLDPEHALLTIAAAIAKCTANVGDTIVLLPGTHSSAAASLATAGVTFMGTPYFPQAAPKGLASWQPPVTITGTTGV